MARNIIKRIKKYSVLNFKLGRWYDRYAILQLGPSAGEDAIYPYELLLFQAGWSHPGLFMRMGWVRCKKLGLVGHSDTGGRSPEVLNERSHI